VAQHLRFGIYHRVRFAGQKNTPTRDGFFKDELPAKKNYLRSKSTIVVRLRGKIRKIKTCLKASGQIEDSIVRKVGYHAKSN
jgi:hypothetical protein